MELLSSIDGILQPFISPAYHYEDLSFFDNLPQTDRRDGRLVKFTVKMCVKLHTSDSRQNLKMTSTCILQNRNFDPNSTNYMFLEKPRNRISSTVSSFFERFRLFGLGTVGKCVWKCCVPEATLHIIKSVYLPDSLFENNRELHLRIQDMNMYLDIVELNSVIVPRIYRA